MGLRHAPSVAPTVPNALDSQVSPQITCHGLLTWPPFNWRGAASPPALTI